PSPQPGLVVRGEIESRRLTGAVLVPSHAIVRAEDEPTLVLVGDDGIAKRVEVEILGRHGDVAAVKGDVKDGDRVVVEGGYNLPDGAKTHEAASGHEEAHAETPQEK